MGHSLSLSEVYHRLFDRFGPQNWWPGETPVEVMAGAILTQNTSWKNVERAIENLKEHDLISIERLAAVRQWTLARLIRPAGYFNVKARRLKAFFRWFLQEIGKSETDAAVFETAELRRRMLEEVKGVGPETVDSILLYALERPVFVVDAYTRRILSRHGVSQAAKMKYDDIRAIFEDALPRDAAGSRAISTLYNEYHALIVACAKFLCKPKSPACSNCPLDSVTIMI